MPHAGWNSQHMSNDRKSSWWSWPAVPPTLQSTPDLLLMCKYHGIILHRFYCIIRKGKINPWRARWKIYHSLTPCTKNYFPLYQDYFFIRAQNWGLPLQLHVTSCSSLRLIWCVLGMQTANRQLRGALLFWEEPKAMKRNGSAGGAHVLHTTSFTPRSLSQYPLLPRGKHVTLSLCNHDINWQCYLIIFFDGNKAAGHFIYMLWCISFQKKYGIHC